MFLWFVLFFSTQNNKHIWREPTGMHQGAQTDRACIAYNYYSESMNFFKPRVAEKRAHDGICGMEFPVLNYTAACLYKVFGFHDFWYRLILFVMCSFGILYAINIFRDHKIPIGVALPLLFLWFCSPILLFYSVSYLPDAAAMSLTLVALFFMFRFNFSENKRPNDFIKILIFISLSGLIKITYLLFPMAFIFTVFLSRYFKNTKKNLFLHFSIAFMIAVLPIVLWYSYSGRLTAFTGNGHFLQKINPPDNLPEFFDNLKYSFECWGFQLYPAKIFFIFIGLFTVVVILNFKKQKFLSLFYLSSMIGVIGVLCLFSRQFKHHDYYFNIFYPLLFIGFLLTALVLKPMVYKKKYFVVGLNVFLLPLLLYHFFHANRSTIGRFETGNYLNQVVFSGIENYTKYEKEIQNKIPVGEKVLSAFDPQPNATLYLIKRSGVRVFNDFDTLTTRKIIEITQYKYYLINDSQLWNQKYMPHLHLKLDLLWHKANIWLYQSKH